MNRNKKNNRHIVERCYICNCLFEVEYELFDLEDGAPPICPECDFASREAYEEAWGEFLETEETME